MAYQVFRFLAALSLFALVGKQVDRWAMVDRSRYHSHLFGVYGPVGFWVGLVVGVLVWKLLA